MLSTLTHSPANDASMSHLWSLETGAQPLSDKSARFTLWAPHAAAPRVRVHTGAATGDHAMEASSAGDGFRTAIVAGAGAGDDYSFVLDDGRERPDPVSRWQPFGVHGASRIVDPAYDWTDSHWRGVRMNDLSIYELHVGTFTPQGTFAAAIDRLPALAALGVAAIELMPVAEAPGERNWGYDGAALFAVQHRYGGPVGLKALVDTAHRHGLGVILDVVYNHVGPEGNYLADFGPYFTDKYRTPWGAALNFDGPDSDHVRRFVLDNARYWPIEYHVDGLRLDAVHTIHDQSATHLLEEIAGAVHDQAARLGKSVVVIAESDLNDPRLLRDTANHGMALDGQWADDFHHAVHAALTGERVGYYADFGDVTLIAEALRQPFVLDGRYSAYRRRRHGGSSAGVPRSRFVVALQNHDQVGNRARGDRLAALLSPAQLRLAAALLLLSPYVPLLFMGEEYGETRPFHYFVDHGDAALSAAVLEGRQRELATLGWNGEGTVADPAQPSTFAGSRLEWAWHGGEPGARLEALYRDLLALRRDEPLLRPDGARVVVDHGASGWITLLRESPPTAWSAAEPLLALFNCSDQPAHLVVPGDDDRAWTLRLSTDAAAYGGSGALDVDLAARTTADAPRRLTALEPRAVHLAPWSAALYVGTADVALPSFTN